MWIEGIGVGPSGELLGPHFYFWVTTDHCTSLYTRSAVSLGLSFHPMALSRMEASPFGTPNFWQVSGTQLMFNITYSGLALTLPANLGPCLSSLMGKSSKIATTIQYHPCWWPWFSRNSVKPAHLTEPSWMNYFVKGWCSRSTEVFFKG